MKRIFGVLAKTVSLFFQGGLLGGKMTPQGRFAQFLLAALIALLVLSRFYTQELGCSRLPTDIVVTSNWKVVSSTIPVNLVWERTLTGDDSLLATSGETVAFYRGATTLGCGEQLIALDTSNGNVKWRFPVELVRNITPIPNGYLVAKCCSSIILLDANGAKVWETETIDRTVVFDSRFVFAEDKAYFITGSDTYKLSLDDGSLERIKQGSQNQEASWLQQLIFPVGTSNYRVYHGANVLITARLPDHFYAYQIPTGELLWDAKFSFQAEPVFDGNHLITYNSQKVIQIHDIHSGHEIGSIVLQPNTQPNNATTAVIVAAAAGKIFIRDFQTSELIALNIELPE